MSINSSLMYNNIAWLNSFMSAPIKDSCKPAVHHTIHYTHKQVIIYTVVYYKPSGFEVILSNSLLTMVLTKLSLNNEQPMDSKDHVIHTRRSCDA